MKLPVYCDYNATTPVDPRVEQAMRPFLRLRFGNPSSRSHSLGREASEAVERAREQLASALGGRPEGVHFTSGATESNNLALKGVMRGAGSGAQLVTAATEHPAVLDCARRLEREGTSVSVVPVGEDGRVDPQAVADALTPRTALVSVMAVNNETGIVNPLREIAAICRERGVPLHCDAVQAFGKIAFSVELADLVSLTAHKTYGPKGGGALYVRPGLRLAGPPSRRLKLLPLFDGGGQEGRLRPGTLNVPAIVGLGRAAQLVATEREAEAERIGALRRRLQARLLDSLEHVRLNGDPAHRAPGTLNVSFDERVTSEALMRALPDVAFSSGSACASASGSLSHVLEAMGLERRRIEGAIRLSLGRFSTVDEVDYIGARLVGEVRRLGG